MQVAGAQIPRWVPMVIPPREWVAPNIGGYLSQQPFIMRTRGSAAQSRHVMEQHRQGKMQRVRSWCNLVCHAINTDDLSAKPFHSTETLDNPSALPLHKV